jgi:hypothetical protein
MLFKELLFACCASSEVCDSFRRPSIRYRFDRPDAHAWLSVTDPFPGSNAALLAWAASTLLRVAALDASPFRVTRRRQHVHACASTSRSATAQSRRSNRPAWALRTNPLRPVPTRPFHSSRGPLLRFRPLQHIPAASRFVSRRQPASGTSLAEVLRYRSTRRTCRMDRSDPGSHVCDRPREGDRRNRSPRPPTILPSRAPPL